MQGYRNQYVSLKTTSHPGPMALVDGVVSEQDLQLAARVLARYSKGKTAESVEVEIRDMDANTRSLKVTPMGPLEIRPEWML